MKTTANDEQRTTNIRTRRAASRVGLFAVHCSLFAFAFLLLPACQPEEKILRYKPFFSNVEGAKFGGQAPVNANAGYVDPTAVADNKTVIEHPDGSKTLIAKSPQQMLSHLVRCLDEGDDKLLLDQVISQKTKDHYKDMHKDPMELVEKLKDNRKELAKTLGRMPLAEHSPTVILDQPGDKTWIIKVTGAAAKDLKFTRVWTRLEDANWRFMWLD